MKMTITNKTVKLIFFFHFLCYHFSISKNSYDQCSLHVIAMAHITIEVIKLHTKIESTKNEK